MHLGRKITYAKQHIDSILRHDDAPFADRRAAAQALRDHLDAELKAAEGREAARAKTALDDTRE